MIYNLKFLVIIFIIYIGGCSYGNENYPTFCESNAMFKAPIGNTYGAKFYGTAAVSKILGGGNWMGTFILKNYNWF